MALSKVIIPSDGVTTLLTVDFALGYIEVGDVKCRAGTEVDGGGNPVYRTFTYQSATLVQVDGVAPPLGQNWVFTRTVTKTTLIVNWEDGDAITGSNLDKAQKQAMMAAHEAIDAADTAVKTADGSEGPTITIGTENTTLTFDANGNIVPGPTAESIDDAVASAAASAAGSAASASASASSSAGAAASASAASADATAAADSATSADASADAAAATAASIEGQLDLKFDKTGGGITGDVTISKTASAAVLAINAPAAQSKVLRFLTNSLLRWQVFSSNSPETGGNAGSNFVVAAYDDAGGSLGNALVIDRASREAAFSGNVVPDTDATKSLGSTTKRWLGYFSDLMLSGAAGTVRRFRLATAGVSRFNIGLGSGAETGGNVGSTFAIWRCDDAGTDIDAPFIIDRPTGKATFTVAPAVAGVDLATTAQNDLKFDKTGGTLTGDVTVDKASGGAVLALKALAGQLKIMRHYTGNLLRWQIGTTSSAESGSNNGTNYAITAYADDGTSLGNALTINRASRVVDFPLRPTFNGTGLATVDEAAAGGGGAGVTSFNGRTGVVTPAAGDYNTSHISYSGQTQSYWNNLLLQRSIVSPEEFGLVGDGVTDNSAAWAAMEAALPSTGAVIVWRGSDYLFNSRITATKPHHHIGVPNQVTNSNKGTRWSFAAGADLMINKQGGGKYSGIVMRKLAAGECVLRWPVATFSGEGGSSYIAFQDCYFYGECTLATVYITNALLITFESCRFYNTYKAATTRCVWMDGSQFGAGGTRTGDNVDNIEFRNCIATGYAKVNGSDYAVRIDGFVLDGKCDSCKFFQCKALWCYYGIHLTNSGPTTQVPNFTRWNQGGFENNYKNAIRLQVGDITTFADMYASLDNDVDSNTIYGSTDVVLVDTTYIGTAEFTACQFRGGKRNAYRLEGGRTTITGGQAANSAIRATGYSVDALSTINSLSMANVDCRTLATGSTGQTFAVRNLKGATDVIINGCNLSGYSSGAFQAGGTGTGITGNLL